LLRCTASQCAVPNRTVSRRAAQRAAQFGNYIVRRPVRGLVDYDYTVLVHERIAPEIRD